MDDKSGRARGLHKLRSGKQRVAGCGIFFGLIINLFIAHNPGCAIFLFDIQIVKTRDNKENMSGGNLIINLKGNRIVQ